MAYSMYEQGLTILIARGHRCVRTAFILSSVESRWDSYGNALADYLCCPAGIGEVMPAAKWVLTEAEAGGRAPILG